MPPAPRLSAISYGPIRVPGEPPSLWASILLAKLALSSCLEPDDADTLFDRDARPERLRQALKTLEDAAADLGRCRPRHAAIGAAGGVAQIDRMKPDLGDMAFLEPTGRHHALVPDVAAEHQPIPHRVELRVGRRGRIHLVLLVQIARHRFEEVQLKDEVAEAVEDRLPAIDLDAAELVRAVADELVRAGIDGRVRQLR